MGQLVHRGIEEVFFVTGLVAVREDMGHAVLVGALHLEATGLDGRDLVGELLRDRIGVLRGVDHETARRGRVRHPREMLLGFIVAHARIHRPVKILGRALVVEPAILLAL